MASILSSDIAYRVLKLEQQLDSYQRLHAEELEEIRHALAELKDLVLTVEYKAHAEGKPPMAD